MAGCDECHGDLMALCMCIVRKQWSEADDKAFEEWLSE